MKYQLNILLLVLYSTFLGLQILVYFISYNDNNTISVTASTKRSVSKYTEARIMNTATQMDSTQDNNNTTFQQVRNNFSKNDVDVQQLPQKTFTPWKEKEYPCFQGHDNSRMSGIDLKGLIYVRIRKASSTTLASVNLRIAHNKAANFTGIFKKSKLKRDQVASRCATTFDHYPASTLDIKNRIKQSTFLWTFVREPAKRSISHFFYFKVSRDRMDPLDKHVLNYLRNPKNRNTQLRYSHPDLIPPVEIKEGNPSIAEVKVQVKEILNEYDFIGLTERFDESLVVLQVLLDLSIGDILYMATNIGGHYDKHKVKEKELMCMKIQSSFTSPVVENFLSSDEWYAANAGDIILYKAANRSLDLSIEKIGKSKFDEALFKFQHMKSLIQKDCSLLSLGPCTTDGVLQLDISRKNCYLDDFGCGFKCLDRLYLKYKSKNEL